MKKIQLNQGEQMPVLGLGTWKSAPGEVYQAVKEALNLGYTHIDCAPIYGNEQEVGKAFAESFQNQVVPREQLWVTSKLWNNAHAPENVPAALEKTLEDLQLEYLDLFLIHWPVATKKQTSSPLKGEDFISLEDLPLIETWQAMEALVEKGLCKSIGVSNFSIAKIEGILEKAKIKPAINQVELHPYLQQAELLDFCTKQGIYLTAYSPLGSPDRPQGLKAKDEPILLEDPSIKAIAEKHQASPAQVLISWAIHRDTIVIPKSVNPVRIKQNLESIHVALDSEDMEAIASLDKHRRYVNGAFWTIEGSPYTLANLWDE